MSKVSSLPAVRTEPEFKEQVVKACKELNLNYSTVVTHLLEKWVTGQIKLELELDQEFIDAAKTALHSQQGEELLDNLLHNFDPERDYAETTSV